MKKNAGMVILIIMVLMMVPSRVQAFILINEILADPASGMAGDANRDGVRSGSADEFVELVNSDGVGVDISGWWLSDAVSKRHVFPSATEIGAYGFLVVFGGGAPSIADIQWQTASSGGLGLNNSGDTVSVFDADGVLIDRVVYGRLAGHDQSITRAPDGEDVDFVMHSEGASDVLFSPGRSLSGELFIFSSDEGGEPTDQGNPTVPEWPTLIYLATGCLFIKMWNKKGSGPFSYQTKLFDKTSKLC